MIFFIQNMSLGVALAMDAFSMSLADGLSGCCGRRRDAIKVALVFAFFQALMPLLGWVCVHTMAAAFDVFGRLIPWIALALLGFLGVKMIVAGARGGEETACSIEGGLTLRLLTVQGVATSIDALSVGFTIADYTPLPALGAAALIAGVTFCICYAGVVIGRRVGMRLAGRASIFGGVILVLIGLKIFIEALL